MHLAGKKAEKNKVKNVAEPGEAGRQKPKMRRQTLAIPGFVIEESQGVDHGRTVRPPSTLDKNNTMTPSVFALKLQSPECSEYLVLTLYFPTDYQQQRLDKKDEDLLPAARSFVRSVSISKGPQTSKP